ncbi:GGDEF domain-containing protein [Rhodococcoides fascians]|uniref:GGDEF domain-containing protein n=1 Tax=Rhodococcoides fascians TaxID=1828 RepID=UPI0005615AD3|nr:MULTISPECIES: GGDEF domain-containing protein [Rhodococcus]OZF01275.1 GGDEF domain-containing protein [Rhodococcus sp. 15-1189-1-1a]OZF15446.1 GGDEF domain-containing protein [Rhodococcus sp. 14-2686-1-2]
MVGIGTAAIGLIGFLSAASEEYSGWGVTVVVVASVSSVPVSLRWFLGQWPSVRLLIVYIIYADVALTACLFFKQDYLASIAGTVLFSVVTTVTVVALPLAVCGVHMIYSIVILLVMAVRAAVTNVADYWVIAAHSVTMLLMFTAPLILLTYVIDLRSRAEAALVDPLTGLHNRRGLTAAVAEIRESGSQAMCAIMIDIDGFKMINDTQGHYAGDKVLTDFAQYLRESASYAAAIGRVGGDEFVCLFDGDAEATGGHGKALLSGFSTVLVTSNLAVSAGYAVHQFRGGEDNGDALQRLLSAADAEMYRVKNARPPKRN